MYLDLQCSENVNTKIVPEKLDNIHSLNENISSSVEEPIPDQRSSSKEEKDEDEDLTDLVVCAHAIVVGLIFYTDPWTGTIVLLFYLLFVPLPSIF